MLQLGAAHFEETSLPKLLMWRNQHNLEFLARPISMARNRVTGHKAGKQIEPTLCAQLGRKSECRLHGLVVTGPLGPWLQTQLGMTESADESSLSRWSSRENSGDPNEVSSFASFLFEDRT